MKRKNNAEVLRSALSAIKNKYDDAGDSVNETKYEGALIAASFKVYLSFINERFNQTMIDC